jgi:hypothetical protein
LKIKGVVMRRYGILFLLTFAMLMVVSGAVFALDEEAICAEVGGEWQSGIYRCTIFVFGQNERGIDYSYEVHYPTRISSEPFILTALTDYVQTVTDEFMAGVDATADAPGALFLETDFEIFHYNEDITSILFYTSTYLGGASPFLFVGAMTFDNETDQQLELSDLFIEGADYITPIKSAVQADLIDQLGEDLIDFIEAGTGDDPANYQTFVITDDALIFFFSEGDVGPNAAGPRSARVPLSDLSAIWALDNTAGPAS